jgi:hypothetical protein
MKNVHYYAHGTGKIRRDTQDRLLTFETNALRLCMSRASPPAHLDRSGIGAPAQ